MRIPASVGYALSAAAAITLLAGCSGSGSVAPANNPTVATQMVAGHAIQRSYSVLPKSMQQETLRHQPGQIVVDKKKKKKSAAVYVSSYGGSNIECYSNSDKKGKNTGSISSGLINPQGEAAMGKSLVVANTGASNVLVYTGCGKSLNRTMTDPTGYPVGVTAAKDGNIYVSNIFDFSGNGEVLAYSPSNNGPGVHIGDPNLIEDFFIAVNPSDSELCVDGFNNSGLPEVDCSSNGGSSWGVVTTSIGFPGGLAFEKDGTTLLIDDQLGTISDGTNTISCPGSDCVNVAFGKADTHLYAGDAGTNTGHQIDWPSGSLDFDDNGGGSSVISAQPIPGG